MATPEEQVSEWAKIGGTGVLATVLTIFGPKICSAIAEVWKSESNRQKEERNALITRMDNDINELKTKYETIERKHEKCEEEQQVARIKQIQSDTKIEMLEKQASPAVAARLIAQELLSLKKTPELTHHDPT